MKNKFDGTAPHDATTHERASMRAAYNSCPVGGDVIEIVWNAARRYVPPTSESAPHTETYTLTCCKKCGEQWPCLHAPPPLNEDEGEAIEMEAARNDMLQSNNAEMRKAGTALAEAALRVIREYDGVQRLALAVADWSKAIAGEGGRS